MKEVEIPKEILNVAKELHKAGHEAYLVGGPVRDILMGKEPKDWDIATNAKPEEIQKVFSAFANATADRPATIYENNFGTVGVKTEGLGVVEVTTYRIEGRYTDKRHPDEVKFAKTIEEDLGRRDFTINAMALEIQNSKLKNQNDNSKFKIIDPYNGQEDLRNKIIRTVGNPNERFGEDALRLMRTVRFAAQLGFKMEEKTKDAIKENSKSLKLIAIERIRDEFVKIIMTPSAKEGLELLEEFGLLEYVIPELREGIAVSQNRHHIYEVFEHELKALDYAAKKDYSLEVRMAALLHDIGKPKTKHGEGEYSTFYNHEQVGARMAQKILDNLKFPKDSTEKIVNLIRYHMFYYNVDEVSAAGVRRFLARIGPENVDDFIKIREADRIGSGVPKAVPYKIRHLLFMIEKVKSDPVSPKMLKVKGNDVMEVLGIEPGPKVGQILSVLLEEVLDDPKKNASEYLVSRIKELGGLSEKELIQMKKKATERKEEFEEGIEEDMKRKYYVK